MQNRLLVALTVSLAVPCSAQSPRPTPPAAASAAHAKPTATDWQKIQKDYPAFAAAYRTQQAALITVTSQCSGVPIEKQSICVLVREGIIDATGVLQTLCGAGGITPGGTTCEVALAECLSHAWDDTARDRCQAAFEHCKAGRRRASPR
jgi:hypothetical protein